MIHSADVPHEVMSFVFEIVYLGKNKATQDMSFEFDFETFQKLFNQLMTHTVIILVQ